MSGVRVVIADDERLARARIRALLTDRGRFEIVAECPSGAATLEAVRRLGPDLLFLDVQMPNGTGLDVLERLPRDERPLTIFTTAYDRYALAAFDHHAVDYLLKPFEDERFAEAVARAEAMLDRDRLRDWRDRVAALLVEVAKDDDGDDSTRPIDRFAVRVADRTTIVPVSTVTWIEGAGDYAKLHGTGQPHLIRTTMQQLERRLDPRRFIRVHRSAIVQIELVSEVRTIDEATVLILRDGTRVPVGRRYRSRLGAFGIGG
ncbi:MAG: response regulator transcription factor [Gemmatimonadales bacterium]|nr:response regulator transcription factor [Gemmatimonadales bacterium]